MSEELEQLHILTSNTDFPDEVKEDLHVFFAGLSQEDVVGILDLCREDIENLVVVAQLLEKRKEALIQNNPETWEEVLSFEQELVEQESKRKVQDSVVE
jgi:hypothetical protein